MSTPAWLLGDPTRLPFVGHARFCVEADGARLSGAARVGVAGGLAGAYRAARGLEAALGAVSQPASGARGQAPRDRHALLWRAWELLLALPAEALGPEQGADLALLLVAEDAAGVGVAGVGLSAVWGLEGDRLVPLAEGRHPLLAPPGRPERTPGVLTLDLRPSVVVGCPAHLDPTPPPLEELRARAGVRR